MRTIIAPVALRANAQVTIFRIRSTKHAFYIALVSNPQREMNSRELIAKSLCRPDGKIQNSLTMVREGYNSCQGRTQISSRCNVFKTNKVIKFKFSFYACLAEIIYFASVKNFQAERFGLAFECLIRKTGLKWFGIRCKIGVNFGIREYPHRLLPW